MKQDLSRILKFAVFAGVLISALGAGAILGAIGRHSARFPLRYSNRAADSVWDLYLKAKGETSAPVPTGEDVTLATTFTPLKGRVFQIPIADRGGEGGAVTSVGRTLLLLTHDGRFFAGSPDIGLHRIDAIEPPANGFQQYFEITHRAPYDPSVQNYANFRYNDIAFFDTASGAGLFISYTYFDETKACYATRLSRFDFPNKGVPVESLTIRAGDWRLLFETSPCLPLRTSGPSIYVQVAGGRMAVDSATGTVYLASGNYDVAPQDGEVPLSQDSANDYGKILAIDMATGTSRRLTLGHRNPQGITQDAAGRIWTVEHGPRGGDELNRIVEGKNYGWPLAVYGTDYDQQPYPGVLSPGRHDGFEQPTLAWLPSIAPGTVMAVKGFHPAWDGDLLVGALGGQKLVRVRLVENHVVFTEDIPVGNRVRHLHQHSDGSIILWNGINKLIIFKPGEQSKAPQIAEAIIEDVAAPPRIRAAVRAEFNKCMQCHSLDPNDNLTAPSLARVFDSDIASSGYASYSAAMTNADGTWSRERLIAFLRDPYSAIPGTAMPDPGIDDDELSTALTNVLAALKRSSDMPAGTTAAPALGPRP